MTELKGMVFGRLTVIGRTEGKTSYWRCLCVCGKAKDVRSAHLKKGLIRSCGCLNSEASRGRIQKVIDANVKTGLSGSPTYQSWCCMKQRCLNPNTFAYKDYGGRGITFCERWQSFEAFFLDMGVKPKGTTLERINNDGNYEPGNCKWATRREQQNNRRCSRLITINGTAMTIGQAATKYGLSWKLLDSRISAGWPIEKAILPKKKTKRLPLRQVY